jgi:hypothetical protein
MISIISSEIICKVTIKIWFCQKNFFAAQTEVAQKELPAETKQCKKGRFFKKKVVF